MVLARPSVRAKGKRSKTLSDLSYHLNSSPTQALVDSPFNQRVTDSVHALFEDIH